MATDLIVPFGKYKQKPVSELLADEGYMQWLELQSWWPTSSFRKKLDEHKLVVVYSHTRERDAPTPAHNLMQMKFQNDTYIATTIPPIFTPASPYSWNETIELANASDILLAMWPDEHGHECLLSTQRSKLQEWMKAQLECKALEWELEQVRRLDPDQRNKEIVVSMGCGVTQDRLANLYLAHFYADTNTQQVIKEVGKLQLEALYEHKAISNDNTLGRWKRSWEHWWQEDIKKVKAFIPVLEAKLLKAQTVLAKIPAPQVFATIKEIIAPPPTIFRISNKAFEEDHWDVQFLAEYEFRWRVNLTAASGESFPPAMAKLVDAMKSKEMRSVKDKYFYIELKPTLGDEYPCVLRKLKAQMKELVIKRRGNSSYLQHCCKVVLLADKVEISNCTLADATKFFANEGILLVESNCSPQRESAPAAPQAFIETPSLRPPCDLSVASAKSLTSLMDHSDLSIQSPSNPPTDPSKSKKRKRVEFEKETRKIVIGDCDEDDFLKVQSLLASAFHSEDHSERM